MSEIGNIKQGKGRKEGSGLEYKFFCAKLKILWLDLYE